MRVPFGRKKVHGSQKWIQKAVNEQSAHLNRAIQEALGFDKFEQISWLSPRREDAYSEYRDQGFIELLDIDLPKRPLEKFWPSRGPQWDGLGRTNSGKVLLIEAKANIPEVISSACKASEASKSLIQRSLREVQGYLRIDSNIDWSGKLYQYTNRIAHLYFLREINKIPAFLIFVYFIGDKDVNGPGCILEWQAALKVVKGVLGIGERHRLSKYMADIYLDICFMKAAHRD
jgi:hypothetical protein